MIEVVIEDDAEKPCGALGEKYTGKKVRIQLNQIHRSSKPGGRSGIHPCLGVIGINSDAGPVGDQKLQKQAQQNLEKSPLEVLLFKRMPSFNIGARRAYLGMGPCTTWGKKETKRT